jgi:transposase-like protein
VPGALAAAATFDRVTSVQTFDVTCPHCKKSFRGDLLGANDRQGFKCPHCRLFIPYERATEKDLVEGVPTSSDPPAA